MMVPARFIFGATLIGMAACSTKQPAPLDSTVEDEAGPALSVRDTMPEPAPIGVVFGSSFGMCSGYCEREFTFHSWGIVGVRKAWPAEGRRDPDQTIWARVSPERFGVLFAALDTAALGQELETFGCPDCADGGTCWLKIDLPNKRKDLSYDCMDGPGRLQGLADLVRSFDPSPSESETALPLPGMPRWR